MHILSERLQRKQELQLDCIMVSLRDLDAFWLRNDGRQKMADGGRRAGRHEFFRARAQAAFESCSYTQN